MATKYIGTKPSPRSTTKTRQETMHDNWETMKPFVHFAAKAMLIMVGALVSIVKMVPELLEHKDDHKKKGDGRIIKI